MKDSIRMKVEDWAYREANKDSIIEGEKSPCVSICKLDENNVCIGCNRTLEEVASYVRRKDIKRQNRRVDGQG